MIRVLYFTPTECWPPNTGQKVRNSNLSRELARYARVSYLAFRDAANPAGELAAPEEGVYERVITVPRERRYSFGNIVRGALTSAPLNVLSYTTEAMAAALRRLTGEVAFDIVHMQGITLTGYLPILRAAPGAPRLVCEWHNLQSELMSRYAARSRNLARKLYARRSASTLRRLERRSVNWFGGHVVVTDRDGDALRNMGCTADILTVDNGVDSAAFCDERLEEAYRVWPDRASGAARSRVLFVGSMDYYANVDCVLEFVTGAWPRIARQQPHLRFTIVGRNPPPEVRKLAGLPGVEVTGTVPDVRPYYREALASVVPLRIGGGSRLKILEAMAAGVPVVSTQLGAEGLRVRPGEDIILAESGEDFSDALLRLTREEGEWRRIAEAGRQLVRARYDWGPLAARLHDGYLAVLGRAPR